MAAMVAGCVCDIIGYGGRIMLYKNPFLFTGFLVQITKQLVPFFTLLETGD